jgi:hypothetical protein
MNPGLGRRLSILAVEVYHAGNIRTVLFEKGQGPATAAISAVRAMLSGRMTTRALS